jgi:hypothetical protein
MQENKKSRVDKESVMTLVTRKVETLEGDDKKDKRGVINGLNDRLFR